MKVGFSYFDGNEYLCKDVVKIEIPASSVPVLVVKLKIYRLNQRALIDNIVSSSEQPYNPELLFCFGCYYYTIT